jgi:hypothetical protein
VKHLDEIEMERYALLIRVRAEASVVRARYMNEVGPLVLAEFDRRLTEGLSTTLELPNVDEMIAAAVKQITG